MLNYYFTLLSVFCLNGDIVTVTTPSDCRWLQVEYQQPGGGGGEKQEEKMKIRVPASGNMVNIFLFFSLSSSINIHVYSVCCSYWAM